MKVQSAFDSSNSGKPNLCISTWYNNCSHREKKKQQEPRINVLFKEIQQEHLLYYSTHASAWTTLNWVAGSSLVKEISFSSPNELGASGAIISCSKQLSSLSIHRLVYKMSGNSENHNFLRPKMMSSNWLFCSIVSQKIQFTITQDEEKQQILTTGELERGNVWRDDKKKFANFLMIVVFQGINFLSISLLINKVTVSALLGHPNCWLQ